MKRSLWQRFYLEQQMTALLCTHRIRILNYHLHLAVVRCRRRKLLSDVIYGFDKNFIKRLYANLLLSAHNR